MEVSGGFVMKPLIDPQVQTVGQNEHLPRAETKEAKHQGAPLALSTGESGDRADFRGA
jgi:hypothetical protein